MDSMIHDQSTMYISNGEFLVLGRVLVVLEPTFTRVLYVVDGTAG